MKNQGIGSWLRRRLAKSGDKAAIVFVDRTTTYRELYERSEQLASALAARGVGPGGRVAYFGENHSAFLDTMFAAASMGAIFVPLNSRLAAPEIAYALADSGATVLIHPEAVGAVAAVAVRGSGVTHRIIVEDAPGATASTTPVGVIDPGSDAGPVPAIVVEQFDDVVASGVVDPVDIVITLDDPAIILYTSGTTGMPKGALLSHGNLTWNSINVLVDYDYATTDVALMISPLFHVASLGMGLLPALLKGATVVLEPRFDPARVLQLIEEHRITNISGVPTTFQMLCEHPDWASADISSLKTLTCGGSAVPLRVLDAYEQRGLGFSGGYGMTESSPGVTSLSADRSREKAGSAGLPHFFTDMRIVDADGQDVTAGEVGEILVQGPNVIREYWNRPEANAEAFTDATWLRTGDMGYTDVDGFLFIADRIKDMIISGGENIYPVQVEAVIRELDAVADVAVIGVPDERWGEVPVAIVTVRAGHAVTEDTVQEHLRGRIARYKTPKRVIVVDEMPRTASGKVRKADLRATFGA
ncbi:acyl-CoA synthetase [Salinibacterium hongtaonis]|uniref:p-hydroxycinnamoyl-CoA synthetase n=1 Tax=Homoserinimonas hongtaonis TaxID=2079791 RepID=A0A2U1SX85_9MICO|nr:long-chain fatty acid--CoA ligase [Salinibacterium hongtaonis]AWB88851.1 p-hydroxycinnamoyl-CoA synthetase [Salinibacterium hongtaonis]PWB96251.1 p-hydroxycinnamoyl-CoA synthetase [Salinibacterium hongtaonis]